MMRKISIKGQEGMGFGTIVSLILAGILLVIGISIYLYAQKYGTDIITVITDFTKNYDGDTWPNGLDSCSCGSPANMDNEQITLDGIKYCVAGYTETTCRQMIDKFNKDAPNSWMWKPIERYGNKNVCVYTSDGCYRLRLDTYKEASKVT